MTGSETDPLADRRCLLCNEPGGTIPQYSTTKARGRFFRGYAHRECLNQHRSNTRRKQLAQTAQQWEAAGQSSFPIRSPDDEG